jgi:hypothetical protein
MAGIKDLTANYRGWHFPEDPDSNFGFNENGFEVTGSFTGVLFASSANFAGATFSGDASFRGATFSGEAWFDGATFSDWLSFDGATFSDMAQFDGATFSDMAQFDGATFSGPALFAGATFSDKASFYGATFSGGAWFDGATFSGGVSFHRATFSDMARFDGATFSGPARFAGATFSDMAQFDGATFSGLARFDEATFSGEALFDSATFQGKVVFGGASARPGAIVTFDKPTRRRGLRGPKGTRSRRRALYVLGKAAARDAGAFAGCCLRRWASARASLRALSRWIPFLAGTPHPFRLPREGESAYRLAKQAAQAAGDYDATGRYHFAEQCAIEDRCKHDGPLRPWRGAFWVWLARAVLGRVVYGYGERPLRPLVIGLAVIFIWAGIYAASDGIVAAGGPGMSVSGPATPASQPATSPSQPATLAATQAAQVRDPDGWDAIYFSIVTFTTLGYGDFRPAPSLRLLAGAEAAIGAALMAVFIVCLTRKYMR